MIYCKNCGNELGDDFCYCPECGEKINGDILIDNDGSIDNEYIDNMRICSKCGAAMPADMFYCLNCGNPFDSELPVKTGRKKWIALLLCIFLGWLGIHRFYEGKIITGLIWLFTFGLFGIGWFVDIICTIMLPSQRLWKIK